MFPSQVCKKAGLKGLSELANLTNQSSQTLSNWYNNKPDLFRVIVAGALALKLQDSINQI
jgi:hypothetical protein